MYMKSNIEIYNSYKKDIELNIQFMCAESGFYNSENEFHYNKLAEQEELKLKEFLNSLSIHELYEIEAYINNEMKELKKQDDELVNQISGVKNFYKYIFKRDEVKDIKKTLKENEWDIGKKTVDLMELDNKIEQKRNAGEPINESFYKEMNRELVQTKEEEEQLQMQKRK